jgi:hypothetical protein
MNPRIEARKLNIIEYLAELNDESVLQQIENLLKPKVDFWDELSEDEKAIIKKGIKDLDNGDRIEFNQFIARYRKD